MNNPCHDFMRYSDVTPEEIAGLDASGMSFVELHVTPSEPTTTIAFHYCDYGAADPWPKPEPKRPWWARMWTWLALFVVGAALGWLLVWAVVGRG